MFKVKDRVRFAEDIDTIVSFFEKGDEGVILSISLDNNNIPVYHVCMDTDSDFTIGVYEEDIEHA